MLEAIFWALMFLLAYTYFLYPAILLFVSRLAGSVKERASEDEVFPAVSLVVAAYNEEKVIEGKINNFLKLAYPEGKLDLWIASDGSSDATNEIVKAYTKRNARVHLIELPRTGKSGVLNRAMKEALGEIVVFSDANTEFHPDAVAKLVRGFSDPRIGCVCGRLIYRNPGHAVSGKGESLYWRYETALKKMESRLGYVAGANGAIYAIRRELFSPLPHGTINDDFTLSMSIVSKGYKCVYEENSMAFEDVAPTTAGEFKRHIRDGAGHYIAVARLAPLLNPFLGVRAFIYWSHRILRWAAPFMLIAAYPLNAVLMGPALYDWLFVSHSVFYLLAAFGFASTGGKLPFFVYVPFYFCNLNLALLLGFIRAVRGAQKVTWERTERTARA